MKVITPITAAVLLSLTSCNTEQTREIEHTASCGDTINQIVDGLKQGVWIMKTSHDTTVYLNDTAHYVTAPMTSGEMIRLLKSGFHGPVEAYDSLVIRGN